MANQRQQRRPVPGFDGITMNQVFALYERVFGPLDGQAKRRMRETAEELGWELIGHEIGLAG